MTEMELDLLQELLTEKTLRFRERNNHIEIRKILENTLDSMRLHFKKPFEITEQQFTEVVQASNLVLRHIQ